MNEQTVWSQWAQAWPTRRQERGEVVDGLVLSLARRHLHGHILDAGCGDGWYTVRLNETPGSVVTGVDVTAALLKSAREAYPQCSFVQADLTALPFGGAHFDGVLCLTVLEWTRDPLACLAELARVVRPGGAFVVGVLGAGNRTRDLHTQRFWQDSPMNGLLPWEVPVLAERRGLTVVESVGVSREGWVRGERDAMTRAMIWLLVLKR